MTITGSTYYNGKSIPKWVKEKNWYVLQTNGARVVIDKSEDGKNAICSPVNAADLQLVNAKPGKTVDELACEVIRGLWGNGTERKNRLTEAGYDSQSRAEARERTAQITADTHRPVEDLFVPGGSFLFSQKFFIRPSVLTSSRGYS